VKKERYIVGVMGKTGTGKTYFVKSCLPVIKRYIILDPLCEYPGVIFYDYDELYSYIDGFREMDFNAVFRPQNDPDVEKFWEMASVINNYTVIVEETENWCGTHQINPYFKKIVSYGRKKCRSMIWISQCPFEIHRHLTRQSNLLISFLQTEPNDLKYLSNFTFDRDIGTLIKYDFAFWGDMGVLSKIHNT